MKPVKYQTDAHLAWNITDTREAISANPDNPKVDQYLAEMRACQKEQRRRDTLRHMRKELRLIVDPLVKYGIRVRRHYRRHNTPRRGAYLTACFNYGWTRLHGVPSC